MRIQPAPRTNPDIRPASRPRRKTRPLFDQLEARLALSGLPTLSINDVTVTEGDAGTVYATFTVSLSTARKKAVSVQYASANGTALAGADYTSTSGRLTFARGQTSQTITVPVLADLLDEPDETFFINLSAPTGAKIARATGQATILDNDPPPALTIGDSTVTEGDGGTVAAAFTVSLSAPSSKMVTVAYSTADGTATAGGDYNSISGTLTFYPGQTSQTLAVPVLGDTTYEPDETFSVNLSAPTNATIATAQGTGTIVNDDPAPTPMFSIDDASIKEGDFGTKDLMFRITLSNPTGSLEWVVFSTADGTATAGSDYTARSGVGVTFLAGVTEQTISIPIIGDTVVEPDETFFVDLTRASQGISDSQAVGTIINDDAAAAATASTTSLAAWRSGPRHDPGAHDLAILPDFAVAFDAGGQGKRPRARHSGIDLGFGN